MLLGSLLKSVGKTGRARRANTSQACQRSPRLWRHLCQPCPSSRLSRLFPWPYYRDIGKKETWVSFQHLPWVFIVVGQEHKEGILILSAACTISWGRVDGFKSLAFKAAAWPPLGSASWENWNSSSMRSQRCCCAFSVNSANTLVGSPGYFSL